MRRGALDLSQHNLKQGKSMDNSRMKDWVSGQPLPDAESQLKEARELLLHFQFIAHGPGCVCAMCERRTAWLVRSAETTGEPK